MLPRRMPSLVFRWSILLVLVFLQRVSAFWILSHSTLSTDRLDPIVSPGKVSSHVHTVVGASNFGPTVDSENLLASKCTTAEVQDDKSSYWAPQLYHRSDNGSLTLIPILFHAGTKNTTVSAFPPKLRMTAGNPFRTTYNDSDPSNKAVGFVCLNYAGTSPQTTEFPTTNCKDGLRAQVTFPSCWNGKDLDSDDHQSHMSYPEGGNPDAGDCPASHPNRVITLFHEWIFDVNSFNFREGQKNWVFSFGDEVGYGFHADFVNGWKQDVLEAATKECTGDLFNDVQKCAPFTSSINQNVAKGCKINSQVDEDIGMGHPISALPGCNPIPMNMNATCSNATTPAINGSGTSTRNGTASNNGTVSGSGNSTMGSSTMASSTTSPSSSGASSMFVASGSPVSTPSSGSSGSTSSQPVTSTSTIIVTSH